MKKIKLSKGYETLVDNEDFEWLNQWKWHLNDGGYALRSIYIKLAIGKYTSKHIRMHREINKTPQGFDTDHINRNKLDNRRANLRTVTRSKNMINVGLRVNNKSGYIGVYWDKFTNKWRAEIKINYKKITLGRFINIKEAITVRKKAEGVYHAI